MKAEDRVIAKAAWRMPLLIIPHLVARIERQDVSFAKPTVSA